MRIARSNATEPPDDGLPDKVADHLAGLSTACLVALYIQLKGESALGEYLVEELCVDAEETAEAIGMFPCPISDTREERDL